jgi:hypothetical protein
VQSGEHRMSNVSVTNKIVAARLLFPPARIILMRVNKASCSSNSPS